jgi:hypothetical protein
LLIFKTQKLEIFFSLNPKFRLSVVALFFAMTCSSQITAPYIVNVAGNQVTRGNYSIEWSFGESAVISIMDNNDQFVVTNGLLQFNVENQTAANSVPSFLPNEVRVHPNPVQNQLDINIIHAVKGNHVIELLDGKGNKLKDVQIRYNGMGALESWDISGLTSGRYYLNVRQTDPVSGKLIKQGAFQIVKIN